MTKEGSSSKGNQENSEDRKASGVPLETGMRKALDRAPGLAAPAWSWMEGAIQGGAVAAGAAQGARWLIQAKLGAAAVGGALVMWGGYVWLGDDDSDKQEQIVVQVLEEESSFGSEGDDLSVAVYDLEEATEEPEVGEDLTIEEPAPRREAAPAAISTLVEAEPVEPEESEASVPTRRSWDEVPPEERTAFGSTLDEACVGSEVAFSTTHQLVGTRVLWNFGDGRFSAEYTPSHVFREAGVYDVTLSLTRNKDGMIRTRTIENMVTIHPKPIANFTWKFPSRAQERPLVAFHNQSTDAASSMWVFDGDLVVDELEPAVEMDRVGEHTVQLIVSNGLGCQATVSEHVEVGNRFGLQAPARFSPNDDGLYDTFMPKGLRRSDGTFELHITGWDGESIFLTSSVRKPWDGQLPSGKWAQSGGRYHWSVVQHFSDGKTAYFSDVIEVE